MLRTPEQARAELQRKGVSVTQWAVSNGFSPNLVFEVLTQPPPPHPGPNPPDRRGPGHQGGRDRHRPPEGAGMNPATRHPGPHHLRGRTAGLRRRRKPSPEPAINSTPNQIKHRLRQQGMTLKEFAKPMASSTAPSATPCAVCASATTAKAATYA